MEADKIKRIDSKYVRDEILNLFFLKKEIFYTLKILLLNPGKGIRCYIQNDRKRMMKPIVFLALCSVIFLLFIFFTGVEYSFLKVESFSIRYRKFETGEFANFLNSNLVYLNLIFVGLSSIISKLFFRKSQYNIFEMIVSFCFLFGEALLVFSFFVTIVKLFKIQNNTMVLWLPYSIYLIYGLESFFADKGKRFVNGIKVIATYAIGFATYILLMLAYAFLYTIL